MLEILTKEHYGQDLGGFIDGRKSNRKEKEAERAVLLAPKVNILEVKARGH